MTSASNGVLISDSNGDVPATPDDDGFICSEIWSSDDELINGVEDSTDWVVVSIDFGSSSVVDDDTVDDDEA